MRYSYRIFRMFTDSGLIWVAASNSLAHCIGQGETEEEALHNLEKNEKVWIEAAIDMGFKLPTKGLLN